MADDRGPRPRGDRRDFRGDSGGTGTEPGQRLTVPPQVRRIEGGVSRPVGRVLCLALPRGDGHPSRAAVAGSLVRSTREHRAGSPQTLAQARAADPLDLAPGGVYRAAAVTCGAGGLLHHRFTLTPRPWPGGGLLSVALSRGSPRVGVTDHPAVWSPDLPHRAARPGATVRPTHPDKGYSPPAEAQLGRGTRRSKAAIPPGSRYLVQNRASTRSKCLAICGACYKRDVTNVGVVAVFAAIRPGLPDFRRWCA